MSKPTPNPLSRFTEAQSQRQGMVRSLILWQQTAMWLADAILTGGESLRVVQGDICIPAEEFSTILARFRGRLEPRTLKEAKACASCEEPDEECPACAAATAESPDEKVMVLVIEENESGGNGLIRPQGPGLILP
jgi:hypothetical protein